MTKFTIDILNQSMEMNEMKWWEAMKLLVKNLPWLVDRFLDIILEEQEESDRIAIKTICFAEITKRFLIWEDGYDVTFQEVIKT